MMLEHRFHGLLNADGAVLRHRALRSGGGWVDKAERCQNHCPGQERGCAGKGKNGSHRENPLDVTVRNFFVAKKRRAALSEFSEGAAEKRLFGRILLPCSARHA